MKNIFGICMSTIILLSGCNDDLGLQNNPVNEQQQVVRIAAHMENDESRLSIAELNDRLDLKWSTGDVLKVINPSASNTFTNFTLSDGSFTTSGEFVGTPTTPYEDGSELYVLYHNNLVETDIDANGNVSIVLKEQNGKKDQDYFLMYGKTTYDAEKGLQTVFMKHLVSIIKLSITTDKTLNKIEFDGAHTFHTKGTLVLKNSPSNSDYTFTAGDLAYCVNDNNAEVDYSELTVSGTFTPTNGKVSVYYYLLPSKNYIAKNENSEEKFDWADEPWLRPQFKAFDSEGNLYSCTDYYYGKSVKQGKMYELNTSLFKHENFANESTADGTEAKPYQISNAAQLYTFMLRCQTEEKVGDKTYNELCYELTNDIELDGSVYWRFFDFSGTFDGKGHTISGEKENTLFDWLYGATICNLTLNFDVTFKHYDRTNYGAIANIATENSHILNCKNIADVIVEPTDRYAGSLIGSLSGGSQMIGCINTGSMTITNPEFVGSLVGKLDSGSTMEACYNTGDINVTADDDRNLYFGDLVGAINYDANEYDLKAVVRSCWSNASTFYEGNGINYGNIAGFGKEGQDYSNCFNVTPTLEQIKAMNAAMTNAIYSFDANGNIIEKFSSNSSGKDFEDGGSF